MEKTKRVKIVTGLRCNIKCVFCYYQDNLKAPNRTFKEIIKDIHYAKKHGITEIDFSGGEPTIHPELPALIKEAKIIGIEKICIITNGLRLSDKNFVHSLKNSGLDEILFSLHGPNETIHDGITQTPTSFKKIVAGINNAASMGISIRTNTVVNRLNYQSLTEIGNLLLSINPIQVNFITINDWCFAKNIIDKLMLKYSEMNVKLKEVCNLLDSKIPEVNVRYIPFCFMTGYEKFLCNHKQVQFDHFEWVPRVRARLEVQNNFLRYLSILGYGFISGKVFKRIFKLPISDIFDESITEALRNWFYTKHPSCKKCSRYKICDGVENTYAKKFGSHELIPITGEKIEDPLFFKKK